uniref:Uncharacterized protein n=2 Tax=Lepeophtheirus salmonis TaxID=72036 RepID=A0A0K2VGR0_LEPSM
MKNDLTRTNYTVVVWHNGSHNCLQVNHPAKNKKVIGESTKAAVQLPPIQPKCDFENSL